MIVTTLPITVRSENKLKGGILLSPFVAEQISRYFPNTVSVVAVNQIGRRSVTGSESDLLAYLSILRRCGIDTSRVWSDVSTGYRSFMRTALAGLHGKRCLAIREDEIYICGCGALEIGLNEVRRENGKVFAAGADGKLSCKSCQQAANISRGISLYCRIDTADVRVYPKSICGEASALRAQYSDQWVRISRFRETPIEESVDGRKFFIDVDFYWSFLALHQAAVYGSGHVFLVTSNRTIRQSLFASWFCLMADPALRVEILTNPIFEYTVGGVRHAERLVADLSLRSTPEIEFMFAQALGWRSKVTVVPSDSWYWIEHSIRPKQVCCDEHATSEKTIENFMRVCSAQNVRGLVVALRKGKRLTRDESELYHQLQRSG